MADSLYEGIPGLSEEEQAIARRRRLAEMMLAQGQQPLAPTIEGGRMNPPTHWTQGLAQLAQAWLGAKGVRKAEGEMTGLSNKRQQMVADAMTKFRQESELAPVEIQQSRMNDAGTARMTQPVKLEGLTDAPEDALFNLLGNPAVPDATRQAAQLKYASGLRREDKAEERQYRSEQAQLARDAEMKQIQARLAETALGRQERAALETRLAQMANESRIEAAQIAADARRDVAGVGEGSTPGGLSKSDREDIAAQNADIDRVLALMTPELEGSAGQATGIFAGLAKGADATLGQLLPGQIGSGVQDASQALREFNQEAKKALVNNPRFPVAEQEVVSKLLPTGALLQNPTTAVENFKSLRDHLEKKKDFNNELLGISAPTAPSAPAPRGAGTPIGTGGQSHKRLWRKPR